MSTRASKRPDGRNTSITQVTTPRVGHSSNGTNCLASTSGCIYTCGDDYMVGSGVGDGRNGRVEPRAEGHRALLGGVGGAIMMGEKAHQQVVTAVV